MPPIGIERSVGGDCAAATVTPSAPQDRDAIGTAGP